MLFGNYSPAIKKNYFLKGWWTDEKNTPITYARVGQKVRLHIQTGPDLPFGESFQFSTRDHDGTFLMYTFYDSITINKNEGEKLKFTRATKNSEIVILEFVFNRDNHMLIDDDIGIELELYVVCRHKFQETELANTSDTWLNLGYDDSDLFIKPAFPEQQYNLPEVYTSEGDMVVYALIEGAKQTASFIAEDIIRTREAKRFITLKVRNLEIRTLGPDGLKKKVFQETIDLATGKIEKAMPYTVVEANEYYLIKKNKVVSLTTTKALETFEREDIRAWDAQTGRIRNIDYGLKAWDAYSIITDMIKLVPNATSNEGMKLPDLSTIVGSIPPLAFV